MNAINPMSKRLKAGVLVLLSLIIFVGVGLYTLRNAILEVLINDQLHKQGFPLQSVSVLDISLTTFRMQDLIAGTGKELRVDKILVAWDLPSLLAGKPVSVEISGLQVTLDLNGERPSLDSLQSMTATTGKDVSIPWLPALSIRDSAIHLQSVAGNATVALSGDIKQDQPGTQAIRLSAIISGSLGQAKGALAATLDTQGNMQGKLTVSDGMLNVPEAKISSFAGEATFTFATLQLQHIQTEFALSGIKLPEKESVKPVSEQAGENPAAFTSRDTVIDQITLTGDIYALPDSWTGKLDLNVDGGRLNAEPINIQQMSVSLPMQVSFSQHSWRLGLRNPGQIKLGKIDSSSNTMSLQSPLEVSISQADLEWVENPQGLALKHDIAVTPTRFTLLAEQEESSAIEIQVHPGKITWHGQLDANKKYHGRCTISDAAFWLAQFHLHLKNISANLHLGDTETASVADFAIGQLQHLAPEPLFAALSVSGSIRNKAMDGKPAVYALNVAGGIPALRYLKLTGEHAPDSGGMLKVQVIPLHFSPDGLQPGALFPILGSFNDVSGLFSANAHIQWSKQGINSRGGITLQNVSFAHEAAKVSDLNATLNLNNLLSPSSPPRQTLTIQSIDPGVLVENLLVSYQIEDTNPSRIALEKAQFFMMDGRVSLEPAVIDPASARSDILIHIDNINLTDFFDLIRVAGLSGSGHLDGNIPITLEGDQVTITNSHLAAKAPGVLRFNSEKASQLLAGAGEEMNLLLQAMQDFHYTELSLNLDKSVTHDLVVKLSLLGNNPDVKDGQAFRLNIKLETDISKILDTINQGYNLSHEILRSSLKLQ